MKTTMSLRFLPLAAAAFAVTLPVQSRAADPKPAPAKTEAAETDAKPNDAKKMPEEDLKKKLTPMQYNVCMLSMTEPAFRNEYWNHHETGIYVDVISGKALFASTTKFDSGTGWPSFFQPIDKAEIVEVEDVSHGMRRIEVRAKTSNAHLGHVFDDGPKPTGLRYCINSASLKFVPATKLKEAGYEKYLPLFEAKADKK
jgi:methionine-R-sulfoxide reductase